MKRKHWKRGISGFCAVVLTTVNCLSSMPHVYAAEEDNDPKCVLSYQVTSSWDTGYTAEIKLQNVSENDVKDWEISFSSSDMIVSVWGGILNNVEEIEPDEQEETDRDSDDTVSENNIETATEENIENTEETTLEEMTDEDHPEETQEESLETGDGESLSNNDDGIENEEMVPEVLDDASETEETDNDPGDEGEEETTIIVSGSIDEEPERVVYRYTIGAENYNSVIRAGEVVTVGFLAQGNGCVIADAEINYTLADDSLSNPETNAAYNTGEGFPYVIYASSNSDNALKINASNLCINGNILTNGKAVITGTSSINGSLTENADKEAVYLSGKIRETYLSGNNVSRTTDDFRLQNTNIDINTATLIEGSADLVGNVNVNNILAAYGDVVLEGDVKNANNAVIYSMYGSILIDSRDASLNGLIYAPFGTVKISAQNLNANGVVIIADEVELDCDTINVNYSSDVATFVGNDNGEFEGIPYECIRYMSDKDADELPDFLENMFGSDSENPDSDGDNLPDGYEVFTLGTDPTRMDSDQNGITDREEDFDGDGLNNYLEYTRETYPWIDDSDCDSLKDGEEVFQYLSDPLKMDTDGEGLCDGDEILLGFSPLLQDTDGNGILDCDEMVWQSYVYQTDIDAMITEVSLQLHATGNLQNTTEIEDINERDPLSAGVVGLFGHPYEISTSSRFDTGVLSFKIDTAYLGEAEIENLSIMWYDEAAGNYKLLDTDWDAVNSTLSTETTHFSRYMVVDKQAWFEAWSEELYDLRTSEGYSTCDTVLAVDCSGSMSSNDRITTIPGSSSQPYRVQSCQRYYAAKNFAATMQNGDRVGVVAFDSTAKTLCGLTDVYSVIEASIRDFYNSGGTNFDRALRTSIDMLDDGGIDSYKRIVLLTDGQSSISNTIIEEINDKGIKVYFIGLGNSYDTRLQNYATAVGGEFIKAYTADDLVDIYRNIGLGTDFDMTDTDGDGLPDAIEAAGIRLVNGQLIYTDPTDEDTDDDGLLDGEEIDPVIQYLQYNIFFMNVLKGFYFNMVSNPILDDSDGDGYYDKEDYRPLLNDIKVVSLKSPYINVETVGSNYLQSGTWSSNNGSTVSYGGNQNWFSMISGPYYSSDIRNYGCGVIAMSDTFLYLANRGNGFQSSFASIVPATNNQMLDDYLKYVSAYNDTYANLSIMQIPIINYSITNVDICKSNIANQYFISNQINRHAEWKYMGDTGNDIRQMIRKDIPVICSVGPFANVALYETTDDIYKRANYTSNYTVTDHYMVITAIVKDRIKLDMGAADAIMYEVSSWGNKYYISKSEYEAAMLTQCGDPTTSIMVIR